MLFLNNVTRHRPFYLDHLTGQGNNSVVEEGPVLTGKARDELTPLTRRSQVPSPSSPPPASLRLRALFLSVCSSGGGWRPLGSPRCAADRHISVYVKPRSASQHSGRLAQLLPNCPQLPKKKVNFGNKVKSYKYGCPLTGSQSLLGCVMWYSHHQGV